jgi:hypothetical protein
MVVIKALLYLIFVFPVVVVASVACGTLLGLAIYVSILTNLILEVYGVIKTHVDRYLGIGKSTESKDAP